MAGAEAESWRGMAGCWYFGDRPVRLASGDLIVVLGVWGTVEALFAILGADVMAAQGYLEEVWDPKVEAPGVVAPWPVVDILDDGRVVARRVIATKPMGLMARRKGRSGARLAVRGRAPWR